MNNSGRRTWVVGIGVATALVLVVGLGVAAHSAPYLPIDLAVTKTMQSWQSPALDAFALAIDWLGYVPQIVILAGLSGVLLWVAGKRWEGVLLLAALGAEGSIAAIIKLIVQRPRPDVPGVRAYQPLGDYTFPSGHVFCYVVIFGLLAYYAYRLLPPTWWRAVVIGVLVALVVLVGPVRIYLGEHWLTDVLAGYLLGFMGMVALIPLYAWGQRRWGKNRAR